MLVLVSGGSASGKSKFAEDLAAAGSAPRVYVATMRVWDDESVERVERHRAMRAGKGFHTLECPDHLAGAALDGAHTALLEDLSNLCANEWFGAEGPQGAARILAGIDFLNANVERVVVVTNELFSDGIAYDRGTADYLDCLAELNRAVADRADAVYEVVCGIPICQKGEGA